MLTVSLLALLATAPLVDAVKSGDRTAAMTLIAQRADVNAPEVDGTTPLHWAVHHGDLELTQRLIRAGAKVTVKNAFGSTPMAEAAILGRADLLEALLKAGADVESPNADGQTALMVVARTGGVDAARLLVRYGAKVNAVEQWRGQTALMWAVAQKQPAMVAELVKAGADVNARSTVNNWERQVTAEPRAIYRPAGGLTPLLYASREGCVECARLLVDAGAEINLADPEKISPLLMAVINGQWDTAQYLIKKGANPNQWDLWGRAPLYAAVDLNTIPRGGRPDWPSLDEATPLQVIEMLLAVGANPNAQLKLSPPFRNIGNDRGLDGMLTTGATPLLRAAKALDAPVIAALLATGADISLANSRGITPIMAAAGLGSVDADTRGFYLSDDTQQRSIESLKLLIKAGGDINSKDSRGLTPLHEAARWGWNDVVQFLVASGADLNARDNRGNTPIDSALGKAGGNSRGGARIDVHEDTAALLKKLSASR
ncbi:MAG TPA: ankyrin repeat domain-containing protein [Vicinamibacterales bacterium]|nr:ankyrin repeat domain-containing protein [Vicinamibacterales bacterium]